MATLTVFSAASDGQIESANGTYATARSGGTLTAAGTGGNIGVGQQEFFSYRCYESFMDFDTSSLGSGATISAVVLSLYGQSSNLVSNNGWTINARFYDFGTSVTTADWIAGASLSGNTLAATFGPVSGWSTAGYNAFTSAGGMNAGINKTGNTRFVLSSSRHEGNNAPTVGQAEFCNCYTNEDGGAGTTRDPKLVVTYTTSLSAALTTATETETAIDLTSKRKTIALTPAVESDSAITLTRRKSRQITAANESDSAQGITINPLRRLLSVATESDVAVAVNRSKRLLLGVANETDSALTITGVKGSGPKVQAITAATETDSALGFTARKSKAVTTAPETDSALAMSRAKARSVTTATETDSALAFIARKARAVVTATETDLALTLTRNRSRALTTASETDSALTLTRRKSRLIGTANETDLSVNIVGKVPIDAALETDTAGTFTSTMLAPRLSAVLHWRRRQRLAKGHVGHNWRQG